MMKYVFGPVPSRRLGRSLGIDPTPPAESSGVVRGGPFSRTNLRKACDWNCVYCQLGRTRPFTRARTRFFDPAEMLKELRHALRSESTDSVDWITFVGSGEPTLNSDLGSMICGVKDESDLPIAVITNGSLLSFPEVRRELAAADAVMPTLDAGSSELFKRINRPPSEFTFQRHLDGLTAFRQEYTGKLWLEVMLIEGMNDDEVSLRDLTAAIQRIAPDEVHLVLPTRPPAEPRVHPADADGILRAQVLIGEVARVIHPDQRYGEFGTRTGSEPLDAAARILGRHPMSDEELRHALTAWGTPDPDADIRLLEKTGKAVRVERYGKTFWRGPPDQDGQGADNSTGRKPAVPQAPASPARVS